MNKNHIGALIEKNSIVDEGEGFIRVKGGLTLTDNSVQHNGTKYDVKSLDISEYDGRLFADHGDAFNGYSIEKVIGKLVNVTKKGSRVVADGIQYAVNSSPLATFAYNMTKDGFLSDFSIGTTGSMPDEETGEYKNHSMFEVSQVGIANNKNAKINEIAVNSIEQARKNGLDTSVLEEAMHINAKPIEKKEEPVKAKAETEETITKQETEEMSNITDEEAKKTADEAAKKAEEAQTAQNEAISKAIADAISPLQKELAEVKENAFDKSAKEPEFKKSSEKGAGSVKNELKAMDWQDRAAKQINSFITGGAHSTDLHQVNEFHLSRLKEEGKVKNALTIADFGNFVISPEQLTEIQGCRNNYSDFVNQFTWRETLSTQMAWLKRSGDINMQSVEFCDDGADGNLKPISEYTASIETSNLEELAAVTPVCNAATRFLAADILNDVAVGYRNDYDRKRAQLIIARLEQAVEANGNSVVYDVNPAVDGLTSVLNMIAEIVTCTPSGRLIMSNSSYLELVSRAITAGISGPLSNLFITGEIPSIIGRAVITVPDDLMPKLNTAETRSFVVNGVTVTVNHGVFYVDTANFTGRISGGLQYDLSTEAAYEVGSTVQSAYQRNEVVLRGSFFRGGAVLDEDQVSGLRNPGVS